MNMNQALVRYLALENQIRLQLLTHKLTEQEARRMLKNARTVVEFLRDENAEDVLKDGQEVLAFLRRKKEVTEK